MQWNKTEVLDETVKLAWHGLPQKSVKCVNKKYFLKLLSRWVRCAQKEVTFAKHFAIQEKRNGYISTEREIERQEGKVISKKFVILRAQKCLHKRIEIDEEKIETTTSTAKSASPNGRRRSVATTRIVSDVWDTEQPATSASHKQCDQME